MNGLIVRNPKLVHYVCDIYYLLCTILLATFAIILPLTLPDYAQLWDTLLLSSMAFLGISNVLLSLFVIRYVYIFMNNAIKNFKEYQHLYNEQLKDLKKQKNDGNIAKKKSSILNILNNEVGGEAQEALFNSKIQDSTAKVKEIRSARRFVHFLLFLVTIITIPSCAIMIIVASVELFNNNLYFVLGCLYLLICIGIFFMNLVIYCSN